MGNRLLILDWHNVEPTWCFPAPLGAGWRGFQRQIAALRRAATIVPLGEALDDLAAGRPIPSRAVALTFDDGYHDSLELAAPYLRDQRLPATFFLVPDLLSGSIAAWWEVLGWAFARATVDQCRFETLDLALGDAAARYQTYTGVGEMLKRRTREEREAAVGELVARLSPEGSPHERARFLDWDGARRLVALGFDIGSHTMTHAILARQPAEDQERELVGSRRQLERELERPVRLLAYPNGTPADFDATTIAAVRGAGYRHSLTTIGGWNTVATPPHQLRRFVAYPERGVADLALKTVRHAMHRLRRAA